MDDVDVSVSEITCLLSSPSLSEEGSGEIGERGAEGGGEMPKGITGGARFEKEGERGGERGGPMTTGEGKE